MASNLEAGRRKQLVELRTYSLAVFYSVHTRPCQFLWNEKNTATGVRPQRGIFGT